MYIPVTFKVSEESNARGAPGLEQVYSTPSSLKVTPLTTTPITSIPVIKNMWLGVSLLMVLPSRVKVAVANADILPTVATVSHLRVTASPTHTSDGIATNGCWYAVKI